MYMTGQRSIKAYTSTRQRLYQDWRHKQSAKHGVEHQHPQYIIRAERDFFEDVINA
jgi:hypothetical protein